MNVEMIRKVCLARHLYELAVTSIKSSNDLYLFSGVNLLQDSVEAFLLAVADFVGATVDENMKFDKYFVEINKKIDPRELPFKNRLLQLNKLRVNSKHHSIQPERGECDRLVIAVREFFDEVSTSILNVNFATVSAIDLLMKGEAKEFLLEAKAALESGDLASCAICCRKAIFVEIEWQYDISRFKDTPRQNSGNMLANIRIRSPFYTKNKEYIDESVREPTGYIVYDYEHLEGELIKNSVDHNSFWNILSLTPSIYRDSNKEWIVKEVFGKLDNENLKNVIEYIFGTTIDILLSIDTKKRSVKSHSLQMYCLELNQKEIPIYQKADVTSNIVATTPNGLTKLDCDYHISGLKGDGLYWHVYDWNRNTNRTFVDGFIHNDYVAP